jgi:hypothetical protein
VAAYRFQLLERSGRVMADLAQIPPAVLERDLADNTVTINLAE